LLNTNPKKEKDYSKLCKEIIKNPTLVNAYLSEQPEQSLFMTLIPQWCRSENCSELIIQILSTPQFQLNPTIIKAVVAQANIQWIQYLLLSDHQLCNGQEDDLMTQVHIALLSKIDGINNFSSENEYLKTFRSITSLTKIWVMICRHYLQPENDDLVIESLIHKTNNLFELFFCVAAAAAVHATKPSSAPCDLSHHCETSLQVFHQFMSQDFFPVLETRDASKLDYFKSRLQDLLPPKPITTPESSEVDGPQWMLHTPHLNQRHAKLLLLLTHLLHDPNYLLQMFGSNNSPLVNAYLNHDPKQSLFLTILSKQELPHFKQIIEIFLKTRCFILTKEHIDAIVSAENIQWFRCLQQGGHIVCNGESTLIVFLHHRLMEKISSLDEPASMACQSEILSSIARLLDIWQLCCEICLKDMNNRLLNLQLVHQGIALIKHLNKIVLTLDVQHFEFLPSMRIQNTLMNVIHFIGYVVLPYETNILATPEVLLEYSQICSTFLAANEQIKRTHRLFQPPPAVSHQNYALQSHPHCLPLGPPIGSFSNGPRGQAAEILEIKALDEVASVEETLLSPIDSEPIDPSSFFVID
jgi:hypothetical protein